MRRGSTYTRKVHTSYTGKYKKKRAHRSYGVRRVQRRRSSAIGGMMAAHRRFYKG